MIKKLPSTILPHLTIKSGGNEKSNDNTKNNIGTESVFGLNILTLRELSKNSKKIRIIYPSAKPSSKSN